MVAGVLFSGLLAVAAPNVLTALNRSREKRTMAELRDWGSALETIHSRHHLSSTGTSEDAVFAKFKLSRVDGWGRPYQIRMAGGGYTVTSSGRDGVFQTRIQGGATSNFDEDLVYSDGYFLQYPEGI